MRGLPPDQAVFKEQQQVAAGRGDLRLSGCQNGIAAESRLFIWPASHLHSSPLRRKRREGGETCRGSFFTSLLQKLMWGWGMCGGLGGQRKLYMVLITDLCSHGCSRYVFMYGSNIMGAQHEEGQWDGGVFPRGEWAHPIKFTKAHIKLCDPQWGETKSRFFNRKRADVAECFVPHKQDLENISEICILHRLRCK